MQVLYLGRASRTKETLPDFLKWRRVTRHPLVFCGLTGSQRTPGFGASQASLAPALGRGQKVKKKTTLISGLYLRTGGPSQESPKFSASHSGTSGTTSPLEPKALP